MDTKAGIIAGHGRLLAARKLQLTEVPVIVLDHLTDAQKRAYVIADNRIPPVKRPEQHETDSAAAPNRLPEMQRR